MLKQKMAFTALGFIVGWYINKPTLWFFAGTLVGVCSTYFYLT